MKVCARQCVKRGQPYLMLYNLGGSIIGVVQTLPSEVEPMPEGSSEMQPVPSGLGEMTLVPSGSGDTGPMP